MEIGIRLHDTAGSNLEEHLRNAKEQGFSCVHIAMSKVVPGFKMADAPELLTDALAEVHSENLRVILDAVNLLDRENVHQAQEVVTDAIARLGASAELLHIKDFLPDSTDECAWARQNIANVNMFDGLLSIAPGLGQMDYRPLMQLAKRRNLPMTLENTNPQNAVSARRTLEKTLEEC